MNFVIVAETIIRGNKADSRGYYKTETWYTLKCPKCQKEYTVSRSNLRVKKTPYCQPCSVSEQNRSNRLEGHTAARNALWQDYRKSARNRNLEFSVSLNEFEYLTSQRCHYCNRPPQRTISVSSGSKYTYNGIDRKDSNLGYVTGNMLPCCFPCNRAKSDMTYEEFLQYLDDLVSFRTKRAEEIMKL